MRIKINDNPPNLRMEPVHILPLESKNKMKQQIPVTGILSIFLLGLALQAGCMIIFPNIPPSPDALADYDPMATNLLAGKGFMNSEGEPDSIRGPGYPVFLAAIYCIFGRDFLVVRAAQGIMVSLSVICTIFLAWFLLKDWRKALLSGLLLAVHPFLIYTGSIIACEALFLFVFLLFMLTLVIAAQEERRFLFFVAGILLGTATLVRSTPVLFPVFVGACFFIYWKFKKAAFLNFFVFFAAFTLAIAPWTARNYKVFHEFILTSANAGNNFYAGSSLKYMVPDNLRRQAEAEDVKEYLRRGVVSRPKVITPVAYDKFFRQCGIQNYKEAWLRNPADVIKLLLYKAARFWYATDSGRFENAILAVQVPFLMLAFFGFIAIFRRKDYCKEVWLGALPVIYFWGLLILMLPFARYSVPTLPFLAIFASVLFGSPVKK